MSKTLIGIVSYGGIDFLKLALESLKGQSTNAEVCVIIADPLDEQMAKFLMREDYLHIYNEENYGFPASVNDLLDAAFTANFPQGRMIRWAQDAPIGTYDNLIIMGNDVVAMPGAIDAMIKTADETDYEMICGSEFNSRFLVDNYAEARQFFHGDNLIFTDFNARPWELHTERRSGIEPGARKDIRNFTLFKRSAFEKVGYADVSFWPNGYYEDNQYCDRCDHLGVSACGLLDSPFFHFWSRTINQGESRPHGVYFGRNHEHYEAWKRNPVWKIESRDGEAEKINHWRSL